MNTIDDYLIKRDVLRILKEYASKAWNDDWKPTHETVRGDTFIEACLIIDDMPTADVQTVIHSRWIPTGDGTYNAYCENCGQERGSKSWNKNDFKYCFGCGARMDLKDGEQNV